MKYFFDTEFAFSVTRSGDASLDLISIGIVAEDGREYYGISTTGVAKADKFVREAVLPYLGAGRWLLDSEIAEDVRQFVTDTPEFWVYMGGFDYVLLSRMMGGFDCWPKGWPYLAYDLRQLLDFSGRGDIRQPDNAPHNAIEDARWMAATFAEVTK